MCDLISVIIPVFNTEQYLGRCIDSVIEQTHHNLEIILVDDGSNDRSPQICDEYAKKDFRIKVIHKKNGGVSSARNMGISYATGHYLCFVDSDDWLPCDSIKALYRAISMEGAEYVAGICKISGRYAYKNYVSETEIMNFKKEPQRLLQYLTASGSYSPYAKLFVTQIIIDNGIDYAENLKCSEDALFIRNYLAYANKGVLVADIVYEYNVDNSGSLSKKRYEDYCEYYVEKLKALETLCDQLHLNAQEKERFLSYRAIHGLRISFNHYFTNWAEEQYVKNYCDKSIRLLFPWIKCTDIDLKEINSDLDKWWKRFKGNIQLQEIGELYRGLKRETYRDFINKIKSKINSIRRRKKSL